MGFLDNIPGMEGVTSSVDLGSIAGVVGTFILAGFMFILVAVLLFGFLWYKKQKKLDSKKIHWFEEVHAQLIPVDDDIARELTIPGTNIKLFYIKKKDVYLPRPVKRMGNDAYWFCIKNNREIVNFTLKNLNEEMKEGNLDYDHTDMRYAFTNLMELIKRNYRDKSQPWWKEFKEVIGLVILIFVMTLSFISLKKWGDTFVDQMERASLVGTALNISGNPSVISGKTIQ